MDVYRIAASGHPRLLGRRMAINGLSPWLVSPNDVVGYRGSLASIASTSACSATDPEPTRKYSSIKCEENEDNVKLLRLILIQGKENPNATTLPARA